MWSPTPGDVAVRRYFRADVLTMAQACRVRHHDPTSTLLDVPVGSDYACRWDEHGRRLREDHVKRLRRAALGTVPWSGLSVLILLRPDRAHSTWWFFDAGTFVGWYVNLEQPARRWSAGSDTTGGWDTVDHALDLVVAPDGSSRWKDDDEFRWCTGRPGCWDAYDAAGIRAEGEAVRREAAAGRFPFDGTWCDRPPAARPVRLAGSDWHERGSALPRKANATRRKTSRARRRGSVVPAISHRVRDAAAPPDSEGPKMDHHSERGRRRVAVVGFGYVGSSLTGVLTRRGAEVVAVERDADTAEEINSGRRRFSEPGLDALLDHARAAGRLTVTADPSAVADAEVVLLTVGTPVEADGSMADDQLSAACRLLAPYLGAEQLVVLKSTVPPGTTRHLVAPLLDGGTGGPDIAYTPERLAEGTAMTELDTLPMVVAGLSARATARAARFWRESLGVEVLEVASAETAEVVKLADNWWIDHNIALANELAGFCDLHGVDVLEVIRAANGIAKGSGTVNILTPSVGVGGSCLTKDPWMIWRDAATHGLDLVTIPAARQANDAMPGRVAAAIIEELATLGKAPHEVVVAVLGLAFKNDTGDLRATPTRGVVEALRAAGAEVRLHDPLVDPVEAHRLFGSSLVDDAHDAVRDADAVAVLARHRVFDRLDLDTLPTAPKCVLFDGRAHYPREFVTQLTDVGYVYRGVGRR